MGLPPDALDTAVSSAHDELVSLLDRRSPEPGPPSGGSFFIRADVPLAFERGLVQIDEPEVLAPDAYFARIEAGWRRVTRESGVTSIKVLPITVADLLAYAEAHNAVPSAERTRLDHLRDRLAEGAPTISWPVDRNQPCWCGSGRKYKKCCGSPAAT